MCAQPREIGNKLVTVGWKSVAVGWKSVAAGCKLEASSRACMPVIKVIPAQQWGTGCGGREALLGKEWWAMLRSLPLTESGVLAPGREVCLPARIAPLHGNVT